MKFLENFIHVYDYVYIINPLLLLLSTPQLYSFFKEHCVTLNHVYVSVSMSAYYMYVGTSEG